MNIIKVDTNRILDSGNNLKTQRTSMTREYNEILAVRSQLDWDILKESGISTRLNKVVHSIEDINLKILELSSFFEFTVDKFENAEKEIVKKANNIMKDSAGILKILKLLIPKDIFKGLSEVDFTDIDLSKASYYALNFSSIIKKLPNSKFSYKIINKDGKTFIQILTKEDNYHRLQNLIREYIGPELANNKGRYLNNVKTKGIPIYNENVKGGGFVKNRNYFRNTQFDDLKDYINRIDYSTSRKLLGGSASEFVSNIKFWEDVRGWKGATNYTKGGKTLGIVGNGLMIGNNLIVAGKEETGTVDKTRRFVVDSAIDVGSGAAAMAAGATMGSFIAPPLGTLVGAGAGVVINYAINVEYGKPPKSLVGHTKDFVNKKADAVVDTVADAAHAISKGLGKIFW